jgi:pimeloyl-ACP methyl ester carboxylesterase
MAHFDPERSFRRARRNVQRATERVADRVTGRDDQPSPVVTGLLAAAGIGVAAASAWILYSNLAIDHNLRLPLAFPADRKEFFSQKGGRLSYYVDRQAEGRPLVLIHSVNAAASAAEMGPLFNHYRSKRPVFALDLPGFGFSERSKRNYHPVLFEDAILDFLASEVREAADVVALSLSAEFVARAALVAPQLFHSLALISPTGMQESDDETASQSAGLSGISRVMLPVLSIPLWARPFYDLLTTRASIQKFIQQSFVGPVPTDLIDYYYKTAHQPGAEHAPLAFLSGSLFTPEIRRKVYEKVMTPTLVLYDRDPYTSFEMLPHLLSKNRFMEGIRIIPTLGLPHFERTTETASSLNHFWERIDNQ